MISLSDNPAFVNKKEFLSFRKLGVDQDLHMAQRVIFGEIARMILLLTETAFLVG